MHQVQSGLINVAAPLSISERAVQNVRLPATDGRRGARALTTPVYNYKFGQRAKRNSLSNVARQRATRCRDLGRLLLARIAVGSVEWTPFLQIVAHHHPAGCDVAIWLPQWAAQVCPGCPTQVIACASATEERRYTADEIARHLSVTFEERQRLKLWTIGACDKTKQQRQRLVAKLKRETDRKRAAFRRLERGARPRALYEAGSKSRSKPWNAMGMSKSKYYRDGHHRPN